MINSPTVFILGAGSSAPYGYPTGDILIKLLINEIRNSTEIDRYVESLDLFGSERDEVYRSSILFKDALEISQPRSIDAFLEKRSEFLNLGKYFITKIIAEREKNFKGIALQVQDNHHWMKYLKNLMFDRPYEEILNNKVTFITFNYDMSLEIYLRDVLNHTYNKPVSKDFFESIKIHHIHGKIKRLPWEESDQLEIDNISSDSKSIAKMSSGISLVHENQENVKTLQEAKSALTSCQKIFSLGFGFHHENVQKLGGEFFSINSQPVRTCFAAVKGKTLGEIDRIKSSFRMRQNAYLEDVDCCQLLRNYANQII